MHHFFTLGIQYLLLLRNSMPPPITSFSIGFPFICALTKWFPSLPLYVSKFLSQLKHIQFLRAMQASSSGTSTLTILQRQAILFQMQRIHFFMPSSSTLPSRICSTLSTFSSRCPILCLSSSFFKVMVSSFLRALLKSPFCCFSLSMIYCLKLVLSWVVDSSLMWLKFISSFSFLVGEFYVLLAVISQLLTLDRFRLSSSFFTLFSSSLIFFASRLLLMVDFCSSSSLYICQLSFQISQEHFFNPLL